MKSLHVIIVAIICLNIFKCEDLGSLEKQIFVTHIIPPFLNNNSSVLVSHIIPPFLTDSSVQSTSTSSTSTSSTLTCPSYNPKLSICCNGTVHLKIGNNSKCCGSKVYNSDVKQCCNGVIGTAIGENILINIKTSNFSKLSNNLAVKPSCCDKVSYDAYFNKCCNGVVKKRC